MMYEGKENGDTHTTSPPPEKWKTFLIPLFALPSSHDFPSYFFLFLLVRTKGKSEEKKSIRGNGACTKEVENKIGGKGGVERSMRIEPPEKPAHPLLAPNPTPISSHPPPFFLKFERGSPTPFLFHASTRFLFAYWQLHKESSLPSLFHAEQQGVCSPPYSSDKQGGKKNLFFLPIS